MLVAICDENAADRKQTERLLDREADLWIKSGDPLYIYSYGNKKSLFQNFMQYDAILLDVSNTGTESLDAFLNELDINGGNSSVVVIDKEGEFDEENCLRLQKPFNQSDLSKVLHEVKEQRLLLDTSKIELREEKQTLYVEEKDILYGVADVYGTKVYLKNGTTIRISEDPATFFGNVEVKHETFIMPTMNSVVNIRYIEKKRFGKIVMEDGRKFSVPRGQAKYIDMIKLQLSDEE